MKRSKRYQEEVKKVDSAKSYSVAEALKLVKETANTKFDGSVEAHVRLGVDPRKSDQQIRGSIILPHGIGKTLKIAAIVAPDKEKEAKEAGADIIGGEDLIENLKKTGTIDFDIAIATPDMMQKLSAIARILGPRGLMPSPKNETITTNLKKTIGELKKGKISFKNDDTGNIHQVIGKTSFDIKQLEENYKAFMDTVIKSKPSSSKGVYIKNISLASTMGPGVKVAL